MNGTGGAYSHWGSLALPDGTNSSEPNNLVKPEFCVVANHSQAYDSVSGWSDTNCEEKHAFMCKVPGELPGARTHRGWAPGWGP